MNKLNKKYDYLIVGSGLFGSVFAHEATKSGHKCLVIDKREHIGGNIYCKNVDGINIHQYGAHIFHTNDDDIWRYVNQFATFNNFVNSPLAYAKGKLYNLPFNMNTFYQLWQTKTPQEAQQKIQEQIEQFGKAHPKNLEEQAISLVGKDVYDILIKEYTEKQWGKKATELPAFIIKRLPVRFTYDNNYFNDKFQGIPSGGYTILIEKMLQNTEVILETDFFSDRNTWDNIADKIVFTGRIDEFYDYSYGMLEYRSLRFENERLEMANFQGNAVVNYNDTIYPYTRIIEHKHFEFGKQKHTIITREYPQKWENGLEAYYPVNNSENQKKYEQYKIKSEQETRFIFGGRMAEYRYYDMHQIIASALLTIKKEINEK